MSDPTREVVSELADIGILAFTTTRAAGSYALRSSEPAGDVWERWLSLAARLSPATERLVYAHQVHGNHVVQHHPGWRGILRLPGADGHVALGAPTAMAVTLADCVPVFIGHPSGAAALVHSGWKGTSLSITVVAIRVLESHGLPAAELRVHAGPSICGRCYEVRSEVYKSLTGREVDAPTTVDLRELILAQAAGAGVRHLSRSSSCTRCHNDSFFSHRCGDEGRQLGVVVSR